jgi:hypothetical protein
MNISASINDPKVRAEIKDGTLEWRMKSITFYYYLPNEDGTDAELIEEATFTDNNTLKNSEYHPIILERPIDQWGKCAKWNIVKSTNQNEEGSTFNSPGNWEMEFDIEFRGQHKDIKDCMVQANKKDTKTSILFEHYLGMIVDMYAVEGTDDVINVQFGVINKKDQSEIRILDPRAFFRAYYEIEWASDNDAGLVENDFLPSNQADHFQYLGLVVQSEDLAVGRNNILLASVEIYLD